MNVEQAKVRLANIKTDTEQLGQLSNNVQLLAESIKNALAAVKASGISPDRMPSTIFLANEIHQQQVNQFRRIHALLQGIDEVKG